MRAALVDEADNVMHYCATAATFPGRFAGRQRAYRYYHGTSNCRFERYYCYDVRCLTR
jgi:hypothetical protein